jgi:hypothetical protein
MAKLPSNKAQEAAEQAEEWEGPGGALPPGVYLCKLNEVDDTKNGPAGPYWSWEFETVGVGQEPAGRRFWDNTSLSAKSIGKLGKHFEAFGRSTDTDTDELISKLVAVEVDQYTQKEGKNAGQLRNGVKALHPADAHALYGDYAERAGLAGPSAEDY